MNNASLEQILSAIAEEAAYESSYSASTEYVDNTYDVLSTVRGILE